MYLIPSSLPRLISSSLYLLPLPHPCLILSLLSFRRFRTLSLCCSQLISSLLHFLSSSFLRFRCSRALFLLFSCFFSHPSISFCHFRTFFVNFHCNVRRVANYYIEVTFHFMLLHQVLFLSVTFSIFRFFAFNFATFMSIARIFLSRLCIAFSNTTSTISSFWLGINTFLFVFI